MDYKPNMEDIKKLRTMTGAGLADVKKALTEAEGDFNKAMEIIREKGQAIAAKRSDRETSNGCVLVKAAEGAAGSAAPFRHAGSPPAQPGKGQARVPLLPPAPVESRGSHHRIHS